MLRASPWRERKDKASAEILNGSCGDGGFAISGGTSLISALGSFFCRFIIMGI